MEVVIITLGSILVSWGWNTIMAPDTCEVLVKVNDEIQVADSYNQEDCNILLQSPDSHYDAKTNTIVMK